MPRTIGRENVRKRLAPHAGEPGRTIYANGSVTIELPEGTLTVRPAFGLEHEGSYETVELGPLFEALAQDHFVAALLVRLGGVSGRRLGGERAVAGQGGAPGVQGRGTRGGASAHPAPRRAAGGGREAR